MRKNNLLIHLIVLTILIFTACSSDDSNPSSPEAPASVGTYSGTNSLDTTMTITISNKNGDAYLTGYSINYKNSAGTIKGNYGQTDSDGLALVTNNTFSYSLGSESDEVLTGVITGNNTITGTFKFPSTPLENAIAGSYTITKN